MAKMQMQLIYRVLKSYYFCLLSKFLLVIDRHRNQKLVLVNPLSVFFEDTQFWDTNVQN